MYARKAHVKDVGASLKTCSVMLDYKRASKDLNVCEESACKRCGSFFEGMFCYVRLQAGLTTKVSFKLV